MFETFFIFAKNFSEMITRTTYKNRWVNNICIDDENA